MLYDPVPILLVQIDGGQRGGVGHDLLLPGTWNWSGAPASAPRFIRWGTRMLAFVARLSMASDCTPHAYHNAIADVLVCLSSYVQIIDNCFRA